MSTTSKLLALALTATLQSAMAAPVFLNFEDVKATDWFQGNYNGVDVSGSAWLATSEACGDADGVSFIRDKSCGALYLAPKPNPGGPTPNARQSLTLGLTGGFDALSFVYSYSNSLADLQVAVYDDKGNLLKSSLSGTLSGDGCTGFLFCNWSDPVKVIFDGVASSISFTAGNQALLLDDIQFTTPAATGRLPEPASIALAVGALGAAGWTRKRAVR